MKNNEYIPEDFKNIVDTQLENIKINREMINTVRRKCSNKSSTRNFFCNPSVYKFVACVLVTIFIFAQAGNAHMHVDGFGKFLGGRELDNITQYIQKVNRFVSKSNVRLVVEEAITNGYSTLLVFSIISEGDMVWNEHTRLGSWKVTSQLHGSYGPPIISEDGKKLTYYIESTSSENIYNKNQLSLIIKNIYEEKSTDKPINLLLQEILPEKEVISLDEQDPLASPFRSRFNLSKMLWKSYSTVLDKENKLKLEYAAFIPDFIQDGLVTHHGGLTFFTSSQDKELSRGVSKTNKLGYISELTDIRTNKVYKSTGYEFIDASLFKGALGISTFPDIKDPSIVPYLKITKITYEETNILVKDTLQVNFKLQKDEDLAKIPVDITYTDNGQTLHITDISFSKFGVLLEGTQDGILLNPQDPSAHETLKVELEMKNGSMIPLVSAKGGVNFSKYIATFSTSFEELVWNINKNDIKAIYINKERIGIN